MHHAPVAMRARIDSREEPFMKLRAIAAALIVAGALSACASSTPDRRVQTEAAASPLIPTMKTFGFGPASQPVPPFEASARSFEIERRLQPLLNDELVARGYKPQTGDAKPDFVVVFASGYAKGGADQDWPGGPHSNLKGEIVVDAFDTSNNAQVWHGLAEAEVDPQKIDDGLLHTAVQRVMLTFPKQAASQ
jgi:hypothetical protein